MEKEVWGVIVNPNAGSGSGLKYSLIFEKKLRDRNIKAIIRHTQCKEDISRFSSEYLKKGIKTIIAVGGDGTFGEAIQPIVGKKHVTFGAVPAGTGNDFIISLGFSEFFTEKDWEIFFERKTTKIDVGICNNHYFINGMGIGFDAQVAWEMLLKKSGGKKKLIYNSKLGYQWNVIKNILFYREKQMFIDTENLKRKANCFLITIGNGRRFGGAYYLTPEALLNDNKFDICLVEKISLMSRIIEMLKVKKGKHVNDRIVNYFRTNRIYLTFEREVPSHMDGEMLFSSHFEIGIVNNGLNIISNPECGNFI